MKTIDIGFAIYSIFLNLLNDLKTNIPNSFDIIRIIMWYNENYIKNEQFEKKIYQFSLKEKIDITNQAQIQKLHEFNLIYPYKFKKNTPYKICYEFLNKFINELMKILFFLKYYIYYHQIHLLINYIKT